MESTFAVIFDWGDDVSGVNSTAACSVKRM